MVALSEFVLKNRPKRPLAADWRWRHIRLAIKSRYLGNYASQIKSYYGTLSRSHGRSFRIRHDKLPETPSGGEITMTSYPACNKTLLSRKPGIPDKKLLLNATRKSNYQPNWYGNNFETERDKRNMTMKHDYGTGVALSDSVNKTCVKRTLADKSQWRHIRFAIKPRYLGNHASQIKRY